MREKKKKVLTAKNSFSIFLGSWGGWVKVKVRSVFQQASKTTVVGFERTLKVWKERKENLTDCQIFLFFARVTSSQGK